VTLQWLSADLLTGAINAELPSLIPQSPYRRTLGQYETNQATLYVTDKTDPGWERALEPWASVLIGFRGGPADPIEPSQPGTEVIEWGGIVNQEIRKLDNAIQVPLITAEGYLDRRYCGDYTTDPTGVGATKDQNTIVSDVISQFAADSGGLPITVVVVGAAGKQQLRTYNDYDDKTVYAVLQELMSTSGGCEWTMHWQWLHNPERIVPVLYVGTRIGQAVADGMAPAVTFESSDMLDATWTRDWSARSGANIVKAVIGSGSGRPTATSTASNRFGRPKLEFRFTPATSITDQAALQASSDQKLVIMQDGQESVQLVAPIRNGLRYGIDWGIGDDLGYLLTGQSYPRAKSGITRCIGLETTDTTVTPIVLGTGL
jgi:hypothetical protein